MRRRRVRPPLALPWDAALSQRIALELWEVVAPLVNGSAPPEDCPDCRHAWTWLRTELDSLLAWSSGMFVEHHRLEAPVRLSLCLVDGARWEAGLDFARSPRANGCDSLAPEFADLFAVLVRHPAVRTMFHRCAHCHRYLLRPRSTRPGGRAFCGASCRKAWTRSPEGRAANRRRQRAYRRTNPGRTRT